MLRSMMLVIGLQLGCAVPASAQSPQSDLVATAVSAHVLPRMDRFAAQAAGLDTRAQGDCDPVSADLRAGFHAAMDGWAGISHLRFGPSEAEDRSFAIAFWPDGRGKTPKALIGLLNGELAVLDDPQAFRAVSVAARGLYALEFLLFEPTIQDTGTEAGRCALIRAITSDVSANAAAIAADWHGGFADELKRTGADRRYRTDEEAAQELFKALNTGLQFTADARLGRPLGSFGKPRPRRAELRRSERSLRQVILSLEATRELALILSEPDPGLAERLDRVFDTALEDARRLDDPAFAGVAEPGSRFRIEALQQSVNDIRTIVSGELGPLLGVAAGFNSLDGD